MEYDIALINKITQYQTKYRDMMKKADFIRSHHGVPTKEECSYLQLAADIKSELVKLTQGKNSEVTHHLRDLDAINKRINSIRDTLEPNRNSDPKSSNKPDEEVDKKNDKKTDSEEDDEIDTTEWYGQKPKVGLDEVSGMENVKNKLKTCMIESELQRLAERLEIQVLNSFFFVGPPGCGKTYIIKAFVHDLMDKKNYNYLTLDCSQIITKYVGESEAIVKKIFSEAVKAAPCILFIDEIDGMCKDRSIPGLPEYASSLTTAFLTGYNLLQEAKEEKKEIIFIGATNYPRNVDEAMMDRVEVVYVGLPDYEGRKNAFRMAFHIDQVDENNEKKSRLIYFADNIDEDYMASKTKSYNYRDIDRLVENIKKKLFADISERISKSLSKMSIDTYVDKTIEALDNGNYVLTKEVFDSVFESFIPSKKSNIIKDIKEWMDDMRSDEYSDGVSTFPNLNKHPDYIDSIEKDFSAVSENDDEEDADISEDENFDDEE